MYYLINKQTKEHIPNPSAKQRADVMCDKNWDIVLADEDGWIRNSNPRVRPLPDDHKCIVKFIDGTYYKPTSTKMWNFDNTLVAYKPIFEDEQITLQPGVYVSTGSIKEDTYWDGEEWPAPIGSRVEAEDEYGSWREGVVGYQVNDSDNVKMVLVDFGDDWIVVSPPEIRPIDTQKEEWLQKASEVVDNIVKPNGQILHNLYDALKSGELSNPKDLT